MLFGQDVNSENQVHTGDFWFTETHTPHAGLTLRVKRVLYSQQSDYQLVEVLETYEYGKVLTLDKLIMLTERDEFAYHEMMAHVPMLAHPNPLDVLVIGGGDGGCLRELVKHESLRKAVQVEIDPKVVEVCKNFFPQVASAFDHPKVELVICDALNYVKETEAKFDVIIVDSSDPVGPATELFEAPFFFDLEKLLNEDGVLVNQIGSPFYSSDRIEKVCNLLKEYFCEVKLYTVHVPTYPSGIWGVGYAAKKENFWQNPDEVRYNTFLEKLKYYNLDIHKASFALPEYIHSTLKD